MFRVLPECLMLKLPLYKYPYTHTYYVHGFIVNHEPWAETVALVRRGFAASMLAVRYFDHHSRSYYVLLYFPVNSEFNFTHNLPPHPSLSLSISLFCAWTTLKRTDEKKKKCLSKRFSSYQSICKPRDVEDEFIRICFSHLEQRLKHQIVFVARASSTINQKCIIERYIAIHRKNRGSTVDLRTLLRPILCIKQMDSEPTQ